MNKSFTDKLRERREFVESTNQMGGAMQRYGRGGGTPGPVQAPPDLSTIMQGMVQGNPAMSQYLQQRNAYNTDSQNQLGAQVADQINNGVDGSRVDPVAALGVLKDLYTNNQNASNSLFQMLTQGAQQSAANTIDAQKASNDAKYQQGQLDATNKDINYKYTGSATGTGSGSATGLTGKDAINKVISQNGGYLLNTAKDDVERMNLAQDIIAHGGVSGYLKMHKGAGIDPNKELPTIHDTNNVLGQINNVSDRIQKSPKLKRVLDDKPTNIAVRTAISTGNTNLLKNMGLSPEDVSALSDLMLISASGERDLIGGRLTGYLTNKYGPALPGLDKGSDQNLEILNNAKKRMTDNIDAYAQAKGYASPSDLPGLTNYRPTPNASNSPAKGNSTKKALGDHFK